MLSDSYEDIVRLSEGASSVLHRARRSADGRAVILKQLLPGPSQERTVRHLRREFELGSLVPHEALLVPLDFLDGSDPALVLPDVGGHSTLSLVADGPLEPATVLGIGAAVAGALAALHGRGLLHGNVTPANLLHAPASGASWLIDFSHSHRRGRPPAGNRTRTLTDLAYGSPEQTGRTNRSVDERSDLYALGASLYHLAVGRPPFVARDSLRLIHAHLARPAPSPRNLRADLPEDLAAVLLHCLHKDPDDRYQSAEGLRSDLLACGRRWQAGDVSPFTPAGQDRGGRPRPTEALMGRERELALLRRSYEAAASGRSRLVGLQGWSGIGKSRLVQELLPTVTTAGGAWISGKHELLGRGVPYAGLARALGRWARLVVSDPAESAGLVRDRVLASLGDQAAVLVGLVPELELLLGSQPAPAVLPAAETELRLRALLQQLFSAIAAPGAPVVLFLDDLQWADAATLQMLGPLVTQPSCRHVLVVAAWRENEVGPDHPLTALMGELQDRGAALDQLRLGPLSSAATLEVVARSLRVPSESVKDLAGALWAGTGGSPFYVGRLLAGLWEDGELQITPDGLRWNRQARHLARAPSDAVVFLQERLRRLEPPVQRVLSIGAWLGSRFTALDVARILALPVATVAGRLDGEAVADMVRRDDDSPLEPAAMEDDLDPALLPAYRFLHDRVQQAAADLTAAEEVPAIRLAIARHLAGGNREQCFEAVDHALHAGPHLHDPMERHRFAALAATAGRQAAAAAAFDVARRIFEAGIGWGGDGLWNSDPALALELALGAAEACHLVADRTGMERHVARVLQFSRDPLARLRADEIATLRHVAANEINAAIDRAAGAVHRAGGSLHADPGAARVLLGLARCRWVLRGRRSDARLRRLPLCRDRLVQARMRLEAALFSPAFYGRPRLFPLLAFTLVGETLRHGVTPESCVALVVYGIVRASTGDLRQGIGYGRTALALQSRLPDQRLRFRTEHIWNAHLRFWIDPWHACRDDLTGIHRGCWENGDVEYAAFAAFMSCTLGLHTGEPLEALHRRNAEAIASIRSLGQQTMLHTTRMHHQIIENLLGRAADPLVLRGEAYDETAMEPVHRAADDRVNLHCLAVSRAVLFLFFGDPHRAARALRSADPWDDDTRSQPLHVVGRFLDALAHAAIGDRRRARRRLADLRRWSRIGGVNLEHRVHLVEAELAAQAGDGDAAVHAWERGIALAEAHGFPHERGLAFHRASCFHARAGHGGMARLCLAEACEAYTAWGAAGLVAGLGGSGPAARNQDDAGGAPLDLEALLGAARRIAGEVQASGVTATLLEGVVVLAGATRAVLWRREAQEPRFREALCATTTPEGVEVRTPEAAVPLGSPLLTESLRRLQPFDVPLNDDSWRRDPALGGEEVRSALAVPVRHGGRVSGVVLVLHHDLEGAFPARRVAPIQSLVAQAGIALENALHYEELDNRVRERTAELLVARLEAEAERDRADRLLLDVLPAPIAEELKRTGRARPVSVASATVLFSDFIGFTEVAATLSPEALVQQLERCFGAFDDIVDRCGITKLKTIGDGYMAVGGLPVPDDEHAIRVVRAAMAMAEWVVRPQDDQPPPPLRLRIGVHTGPLVAGVIGKRRILYDVWGDTVNVAARLQETGAPGRVNISQATRDQIGDGFRVQPRGLVPVKGKGALPMYFVESHLVGSH